MYCIRGRTQARRACFSSGSPRPLPPHSPILSSGSLSSRSRRLHLDAVRRGVVRHQFTEPIHVLVFFSNGKQARAAHLICKWLIFSLSLRRIFRKTKTKTEKRKRKLWIVHVTIVPLPVPRHFHCLYLCLFLSLCEKRYRKILPYPILGIVVDPRPRTPSLVINFAS